MHEHALGAERRDDARHVAPRRVAELLGEAQHVARLVPVVDLAVKQHARVVEDLEPRLLGAFNDLWSGVE